MVNTSALPGPHNGPIDMLGGLLWCHWPPSIFEVLFIGGCIFFTTFGWFLLQDDKTFEEALKPIDE